MDNKVEVHVSLHYVLPAEERDLWNAQDQDTKASWQPMSGRQDNVGDPTEYVAMLPLGQVREFNAARNCRYAVPAVKARAHGDPGKARPLVSNSTRLEVPSSATLFYHFAEEAEAYPDGGEGVVYFHLDTGATLEVLAAINISGRVVGAQNFTGRGAIGDSTDRNGHGSMTLSLLLPKKAQVHIFKVLGDDGSGSSAGIVRAIRECANIASRDPSKKYILSGSLGGAPGQRFQPYEDACALAESFGVLCRWSAGNDGVGKISAPANWREDRASIAYSMDHDRIAEFSNYASSAGIASHGEAIRTYDKDGNLVEVDGTSFSLPLWNRFTGIVASIQTSESIWAVSDAELATGRDTPGSVQQEPHGVLDVGKARNKLVPPPPPPPPMPDPEPLPEPKPELPTIAVARFKYMGSRSIKKLHVNIVDPKLGVLGEFKGVEVE